MLVCHMSNEKVVIIHQIQESLTNLEDTIEYFKPDYVILVSSEYYAKDKPDMAIMELREKNVRALGDYVEKVEFFELFSIENAWHSTTMMEVYELFGKIKKICEERAGKDGCKFYAGLADGPSLMTVGIAFSAVLFGMSTYFTRGRRTYYEKKYVLEIENLNKITATSTWLDKNYKNKDNLRYLSAIIELEEEGVVKITAQEIEPRVKPKTIQSVRNAIRVLEEHDLIKTTGKTRPKIVQSTELGRIFTRMFYN